MSILKPAFAVHLGREKELENMTLQMLPEGSHASEGINSNFKATAKPISIRMTLGGQLSCLMNKFYFGPRTN